MQVRITFLTALFWLSLPALFMLLTLFALAPLHFWYPWQDIWCSNLACEVLNGTNFATECYKPCESRVCKACQTVGRHRSSPNQLLPELPPEPDSSKPTIHLLPYKMTICKGVLEWQKDPSWSVFTLTMLCSAHWCLASGIVWLQ